LRPYPLIPAEEYTFCDECDSVYAFVDKAVEAHPATRMTAVGAWRKAVILFDDGESQEVDPGRTAVGLA
jgi:hypothetical protein